MRYKREGENPRAGGAFQGRTGRSSTGPAVKALLAFLAAYLIFGATTARPFSFPLFTKYLEEEFSEVRGSNLRRLVSNEAAIVSG